MKAGNRLRRAFVWDHSIFLLYGGRERERGPKEEEIMLEVSPQFHREGECEILL